MTEKLRKAAKQALADMMSFEAGTGGLYRGEFAESITALRAALAEQPAEQEPVAPARYSEIALMEKAVKRVGMVSLLNQGAASCVYTGGCEGVSQDHLLAYTREIALHCAAALSQTAAPEAPQPAKRVPLTDDEIDAISDDHRDWTHQIGAFRRFARAIEAAHGIKGETE